MPRISIYDPLNPEYRPYPTTSLYANTYDNEKPTKEHIQSLLKNHTISDIAKQYNMTRHTIYRILSPEYDRKHKEKVKLYAKDKRYYDTELRRLQMKRYRLRKQMLGYTRYNPKSTNEELQIEYDNLTFLIKERNTELKRIKEHKQQIATNHTKPHSLTTPV